jgi:hypothetical protein
VVIVSEMLVAADRSRYASEVTARLARG